MSGTTRWPSMLRFLWGNRSVDKPKRPANKEKPKRPANNAEPKRPANNAKPKRPANKDKAKRPADKPVPVSPVDSIELRHLDGAVAEVVRAFFACEVSDFRKDEGRSVRIAHPEKEGMEIKIKGAGLYGRGIKFGTLRKTGPTAPVFDYDGRMMEDVASGHDNAYVGGASFQQASTEYRMTQRLASLGYKVVPCLGLGKVQKDDLASWFSVLEMQADWAGLMPPKLSIEAYCAGVLAIGVLMRDLAVKHDLIGYAWYVAAPDGERIIKDLHPFRMADPISMSQLSWVMQLFYALHITANSAAHGAALHKSEPAPPDMEALCFRAILPSARDGDHQRLQRELVNPYMHRPPENFDQRDLVAVLRSNPITEAMLELCPAKYERY